MKLIFFLLVLAIESLHAAENPTAERLAEASRRGELKMAETLLSSGVDPELPDRYGRTALYYAALFNQTKIVELLLANHADPNPQVTQVNRRDAPQFPATPLQNAAYLGNLRIASILIASGAHVNAEETTGCTALHFAVLGRHLDVVQLLIEKGADLNARDAEGASSLDDAVWRGSLDAVAVLLAHGARLNETDSRTGATPINEAAYLGETPLVRYLLQFNPDLEVADKQGYSPLENATRMGKEDCALLLLEAEAKEHETPRFLGKVTETAIKRDESLLVASLLRYGVLANETLPSGSTLLEAGASARAIKVVRVLLSSGADPGISGRNGNSPLEDASLSGFEAMVSMLLDHGAPVNQINTGSGTTALYAAASFGKAGVVKLLLQRGANPTLCGKNHKSPYQAALENGYSEAAAEIQKHGEGKSCEQ